MVDCHEMEDIDFDEDEINKQAEEQRMHLLIESISPKDPNFLNWNAVELGTFLSHCGVKFSLDVLIIQNIHKETYNGETFLTKKAVWISKVDQRETKLLEQCHQALENEKKFVLFGIKERGKGRQDHDK